MRVWNVSTGLLATALLSCGGGRSAPSGPSTATDESRASFTLQGAGYNNVAFSYAAASNNLVFCRTETPLPNTIWIRMAASRAGDGEASPHIDIDLCNFAGTSTYSAIHNTTGERTCSQGATFAIWWHDGGRTFVSPTGASPCSVSVTRSTGRIDGTFECRGLAERAGAGASLDVGAGSFRCNF